MRFRASIIIAAITLAAAGPAGAQFPNCIKSVSNQELNPNADGTYPPDPAVPYSGTHTTWSTDGVVINLKMGDQEPSQFYIRGINYEPTQIGGGAGLPPFNDFFTQTLLRPSCLYGVTTAAKTSERCVRWG